jgi:hypothetical protein
MLLIVYTKELTPEHLHMKFTKFHCSQNKEFEPRYYAKNFDNFCDVTIDETLALMWGRHPGTRTVLIMVHIVNKSIEHN